MVKISVILPIYNIANFLEESLKSVLNQTLKDIEVICINDGSTDNSLEILNKFAKKDNRIKIIDKKNEGTGVTRNIGLNEASGDYIYFFDPDDYIVENTLYELYENITLNNSDFGCVFGCFLTNLSTASFTIILPS